MPPSIVMVIPSYSIKHGAIHASHLLRLKSSLLKVVMTIAGVTALATHLNDLVFRVDELDVGDSHANWITLLVRLLHTHTHKHRTCEDCPKWPIILLDQCD